MPVTRQESEWSCKTNLTPPLFIEVPVTRQESEWSCKTNLTPPLFIEVPVTRQESEWSCKTNLTPPLFIEVPGRVYVLRVSILCPFPIGILNCFDGVVFVFCFFCRTFHQSS